jgi:phosphopantothenoylcysteine synthetase/decarboxylase
MLEDHKAYLTNIQTLKEETVTVVAPIEVEIKKYSTLPQDLEKFAKVSKKDEKIKGRKAVITIE